MTPERETSQVSHGKENPVLMGLTAAPGLKESTAGDEALSEYSHGEHAAGWGEGDSWP